ncbi:MAG: LytTR family transcriptional regulator, partial [Staphylococcus equorum]|nr:LytTR family transcriptional regulator [Staphylococcus equorum]
FEEHFKKILTKIKHTSQPNYMLKTNSGFRKILLDDLFYIESEGHYLHFYSQSGTYTILESMKKVEEQLEENGFFRCNNGYLVNLKHVKNLEGNVATVGPYKLQVSRPRKKGFLTALTNYLESKE